MVSICLILWASGTLNGCFSRFETHFLALLNERSLEAVDLVLSHFSNLAIRESLGVTTSTVDGFMEVEFNSMTSFLHELVSQNFTLDIWLFLLMN